MSKNPNEVDIVFERAEKHVQAFRVTLLDASPYPSDGLPDLSTDDLKAYFKKLPTEIQDEAFENGMDDGLFIDDVYFFFKAHQNLFKQVA